jgi:alcohol dehydrogenase
VTTIRSVQVSEPGGSLSLVADQKQEPRRGQVRIAVEACGICHTDATFVHGLFPGLSFPLTPGHEIAGRIDAIGEGIEVWKEGDRVAVGWFGGHCGHCDPCRRGDFIHCQFGEIPGLSYPGGYADAIVVPANALARIPEPLSAADAAPLACAGVTVFNALRRSHARPGDLVAILGLGGLGHLGVQFADKMGFHPVVIARGQEKAGFATDLGARDYIDSTRQDVAAELQPMGGASVILATASNSEAIAVTVDGLAPNGELLVVGADAQPMPISPIQLISHSKTVHGHPAGTAMDIEETMRFAALSGVRAIVEQRPLDEVQAAFDRMLANEARFRIVLTTAAGA